ncbi:MAG: metallophosphoesterase, partial [Allosphingosinicella sp.]
MQLWNRITTALMPGGEPRWQGPQGARAYGIGDIHGRLDLLDELLARIEADFRARPVAKTFIVFLGDLIDRGAESAGVVERLRTYRPEFARPVFLAGNHEEVFLRVLNGEPGVLDHWLKFGGTECVASYGLDPGQIARMEEPEAVRLLERTIPREHVAFLESFGDTFRFGNYLFVHAGIRPGVALEEQTKRDLRWIREPFLSDN